MRSRSILFFSMVLALAACGPKVASVDVDPASVSLLKRGEGAKLKLSPKDKAGAPVEGLTPTFISAAPAVATVAANGTVTAVATGETSVQIAYGEQLTKDVPVKVMIATSVVPSQTEARLEGVGSKLALSAKVLDEKGGELPLQAEWSSENEQVVTVAKGELVAVAPGEAKVVAKAGDAQVTIPVTVLAVVETIEVPAAAIETKVGGEPIKLAPVGKDAQGNPVATAAFTYVSADPAVATVDEAGTVTAVKKGATQITITSGARTATVEVTVK